jgi:hypothetical protein
VYSYTNKREKGESMNKLQVMYSNLLHFTKSRGDVPVSHIKMAEKILADSLVGKGHSESDWVCEQCDQNQKITGVPLSSIADGGVPMCTVCGEDMTLISERWIEEVGA